MSRHYDRGRTSIPGAPVATVARREFVAPLSPEVAAAQREADIAILRAVLVSVGGNVRKAAVHFAIHPSTVHRRIDALGLRSWLTKTYPRSKRQPR